MFTPPEHEDHIDNNKPMLPFGNGFTFAKCIIKKNKTVSI